SLIEFATCLTWSPSSLIPHPSSTVHGQFRFSSGQAPVLRQSRLVNFPSLSLPKTMFHGIFPALTTKFNEKEELDLPAFTKNLEAQMAAGVHGIVLGGTLGEASVLTTDEKETLVRHSVEVVDKKIPVIMNIAEGSTKEAIRQAKLAKQWGANGLMLLPPMRYKSDHRETVTWFSLIAASTNLPIMVYN